MFNDVFLLESGQLFKVLVDVGVEVVDGFADVTGFRAEEDHEDVLETTEGKEDPETVFPAQVGGDGSGDDGNQVGDGSEDEIEEGNSNTTLVHEVHVANDSDDN